MSARTSTSIIPAFCTSNLFYIRNVARFWLNASHKWLASGNVWTAAQMFVEKMERQNFCLFCSIIEVIHF